MKQIKFDARFKEAILKKEKVATIRNSKKVDVGEIFEIVVNGEKVGKAECIGVLRIEVKEVISNLLPMHDNLDYFVRLPVSIKNKLLPAIHVDIFLHKLTKYFTFNACFHNFRSIKQFLKNRL